MRVSRIAIVLLAIVFNPPVAHAVRVDFQLIPEALSADDMSPDGRFIVGFKDVNGDEFPDGTFMLDQSTGVMTTLPAQGSAPLEFLTTASLSWVIFPIRWAWDPTSPVAGRPPRAGSVSVSYRMQRHVPV